jgi:hypothetical protein
MNKSLAFFGREKLLEQLRRLYQEKKHVLIVGPAGIGKTAILRQLRQVCPFLHCEETSSLRRIADGLERQLGWTHRKLNVIERKNRLLAYLTKRGEPVAFDHLSSTVPRIAQFIRRLGEAIPVWISCRSSQPPDIGHVWQHIYNYTRIEVPPLTTRETQRLISEAISAGNIQPDARRHMNELHRLSKGNPRLLEELLIELSTRHYRMDSFGVDLLELDRKIHELDNAIKAVTDSAPLDTAHDTALVTP